MIFSFNFVRQISPLQIPVLLMYGKKAIGNRKGDKQI
jgi:hypothetical protein